MPAITKTDNTDILCDDWDTKDASPIVFRHGWPLSSGDRVWEVGR